MLVLVLVLPVLGTLGFLRLSLNARVDSTGFSLNAMPFRDS